MRVLMATDVSWRDDVALRFGVQIARRAGEPPTVLAVISQQVKRDATPVDPISTYANEFQRQEVPNVQCKVRVGHPAEQIIREAVEGDYDLVIIGDRQNCHLAGRLHPGSIAVYVVEHAPCPVIVVKGRVGPIQRILICDSGAQSPSTGLKTGPSVVARFTEQVADLLDGREELTVLHVMSQMCAGPGVRGGQLRAGVEELIEGGTPEGRLLQQDIRILQQLGIHPRPVVRHGLVVDEILDETQRGDHDLVVIGAYQGKGWQRILLDDLAHKIVIRLDRPVLILR